MTAKISTIFGEATIENGVWRAEDKSLEKFLNTVCDPNHMPGYLPNPDLNAADFAVEELPGAKLISFTEVKRPAEDGVVY
jgi:hypothetical protein